MVTVHDDLGPVHLPHICYLASPYSHESDRIEHQRYLLALDAAGRLIGQGKLVYSPIAHCVAISRNCEMDGSYAAWQRLCLAMVDVSSELLVLCLQGWEQSVGVADEVKRARVRGIPVKYLDPETLEEIEPQAGKPAPL